LYQKVLLDDLRARNLSPKPGDASSQVRHSLVTELLRRWTPSTANNRYRGVNAYFNWLVEHDSIPASPTAKLQPPRLEEKSCP